MKRSVLRQMISVVSRPGILSFAGGLPASELFPAADYAAALAHVLTTDPRALQYGPPSASLKTHIVRLMAQRGVVCTPEQVFITSGAQQGLDVLTRLLLNPGGEVMHEEIVYTGLQQVIGPLQPDILTIPTNLESGIEVDAIEDCLADGAQPAYLYVIPTAHNPLGVSLSQEKRERLVQLARAYHVPIIEDDPYGFLQYDGMTERPLRTLDDKWVFYLGSFSKILAPALRLGWIIAPQALISKLTVVKEMADLESSALTQKAVAAYLDVGHLPSHLERLRGEYGRRRDTMLAALHCHFPAEVSWTTPTAGMFIWVTLPKTVDTTQFLEKVIEQEQVAFIPGQAFAASGCCASHCMRLNFSNCTPELIEEGIARLGKVLSNL
jgi:2-aminoadipate transaminase